ncbi:MULTISPECIES: RNA-binding S4 domain-containing protein [unclassified Pseudactinotalea]|uniref:RNA-binding S4 domain-containing protein n=1 Tax=unclassified Pseudactinotalea TaxID=2649176 RepID=UPI00128BA9A2|nr:MULTISPECIES: RNA-binding S4 domain-containing protein [unclassified Pseudactinotalea]MPV49061.1 RNA-binding S4 domain-containing protein [Pseudactinotalea sp. HY160]QGH68265.1 RNA-binding S4 domain-containing protein [Pseudactinotalea sp. HY158]
MPEITIRDESIRLGQLLKLAGAAQDGAHARHLVESGHVLVNGAVEVRRGAQVRSGARVSVEGETYSVRTEG